MTNYDPDDLDDLGSARLPADRGRIGSIVIVVVTACAILGVVAVAYFWIMEATQRLRG